MYKTFKINAYGQYYKDNLCRNFLINDKEVLKNILKYGIKIYWEKNLIVYLCIIMYT